MNSQRFENFISNCQGDSFPKIAHHRSQCKDKAELTLQGIGERHEAHEYFIPSDSRGPQRSLSTHSPGKCEFASWRSTQYRKWSVQGIQPHFVDASDYDQRLGFMLSSDVVLDAGHIGWAARLSERFPTVEVRISDAQPCPEHSLLLALLVRALVGTFLSHPDKSSSPHPEVLDLAYWQAAKNGMTGNQLDPPPMAERPSPRREESPHSWNSLHRHWMMSETGYSSNRCSPNGSDKEMDPSANVQAFRTAGFDRC